MLKKPTKLQGLLLLLLVNTLWGLSFIFSKAALEEGMPTLTLAFVRYCVASCILLPICLKTEGGVRLGVWAPARWRPRCWASRSIISLNTPA